MNQQDIGSLIDETGWELFYVDAVMVRFLDKRKAASMDRAELCEVVLELLAPFKPTGYELTQITNGVIAKLRDYVPPPDSPPPQSREDRLYR